MKKLPLILFLGLISLAGARAQGSPQRMTPEFQMDRSEVESALRFLASDELMGRRTGSAGNNIAARYIASQLQALGYQTAPGAEGYYQPVPFETTMPPQTAGLAIGQMGYTFGEDFIIMGGDAAQIEAPAVFAGYGWVDAETGHDDYKDLNVKGKVVFVISGVPDDNDPMATFRSMKTKRMLAAERGALALIEVYRLQFPWNFFRRYFGRESLSLGDAGETGKSDAALVYAWMKEKDNTDLEPIQKGEKIKVTLTSSGFTRTPVKGQNVIGILEGSDPVLKEEYVLLTAHYDHVGTGRDGGGMFSPEDSIFNGARDNAMGTVALLAAAKTLARERPKRSVIVLAVTGEEIGLLGSEYYAQHPLIPLEKTVFNLNTDGAGYNDTGIIGIIGYGRTGTDEQIQGGLAAFQLDISADPAPEQGLFDRSDNVSFAKKGVPAMTFSPGFRDFDQEIMKYYHQVSDEADSVDFGYLLKYCQSFALTARLIADRETRPQWRTGDKYEKAGQELYGSSK